MSKEKALDELEKVIDELSEDDFSRLRSSLEYLDRYIRSQED